MPFVKKSESQNPKPPTDARKIFIGREGELLLFKQNIYKPEDPTHNIVSISGQGGVGKSTLMLRLMAETRITAFKDYCLAALVDERQITPASMMEKFAEQLHIAGEFEKALKHYKGALRNMQSKHETLQDTLLYRAPDFAGAAVEGIPFAGPILREGAKVAAGHLTDTYLTSHMRKDAERLEDPIDDLTRTFVEELNRLADTQVIDNFHRIKRQRRVILFFDTFEQLALEAVPWLLNHFMEASISNNVVLVVAGRDPIEHSTPDEPKRWLPYLENQIIYSISLDTFTLDETRVYLAERGITNPELIETIWQLSYGLPLYLGLLTSNPQGKVDPTADVVANFLHWIPEDEQIKRQVALDAALFSRPFNLDDLEAFTYLSESERSSIYFWLIGQPFVRRHTSRYAYHELVQELFSRHLFQHSSKAYYATRRALADHYKEQLGQILEERGKKVYHSDDWLELMLALAKQLFLLPDEASHIKAVEKILNAYKNTNNEQEGEITGFLRPLSHLHPGNQANVDVRQTTARLLQYIEAKRGGPESMEAANSILEIVIHEPSFSSDLLAEIYRNRGYAFRKLRNYERAFEDFNRALELNPKSTWNYASRSLAYCDLNEYQRAFEDCDYALRLNPRDSWNYVCRSIAYRGLNEYQQAILDCDQALKLNPNYTLAYFHRGIAHRDLGKYQQAIADFDRALELNPQFDWAYLQRGITYRNLKNFRQAIADFDHVLALNSNDESIAWTYLQKGITYLWLNDPKHAIADFIQSWVLDPTDVNAGWMSEWAGMCIEKANSIALEKLEAIAGINPQRYSAHVCRGVALWLSRRYEEALAELEHAVVLRPKMWDAYFWKGMVCPFLGRDVEAIEVIKRALEVGLPPALLAPLYWLKQERLVFFQTYAVPLLVQFGI